MKPQPSSAPPLPDVAGPDPAIAKENGTAEHADSSNALLDHDDAFDLKRGLPKLKPEAFR